MKIKKKSNAIRVPPLEKPIRVKRTSADVPEESTVSKAIENIKKVFEKRDAAEKINVIVSSKNTKPAKIIKNKGEPRKRKEQNRRESRGVVYLGHIPHGFYEEEMKDYFKQFGTVTRVRVVRSRNTGKSRGYGYVEFKHAEVAKVAAETMNNYLMCGRLLKATYIPPEKQHTRFFAGRPWSKEIYPKVLNRNRVTKLRNKNINKQKHNGFVQSTTDKLSALEWKLKESGLQIKFTPLINSK